MYYKTRISFKRKNIKIQYAKYFVQKLGVSDPTTCAYQLTSNEKDSVDTEIIQTFYYA